MIPHTAVLWLSIAYHDTHILKLVILIIALMVAYPWIRRKAQYPKLRWMLPGLIGLLGVTIMGWSIPTWIEANRIHVALATESFVLPVNTAMGPLMDHPASLAQAPHGADDSDDANIPVSINHTPAGQLSDAIVEHLDPKTQDIHLSIVPTNDINAYLVRLSFDNQQAHTDYTIDRHSLVHLLDTMQYIEHATDAQHHHRSLISAPATDKE